MSKYLLLKATSTIPSLTKQLWLLERGKTKGSQQAPVSLIQLLVYVIINAA